MFLPHEPLQLLFSVARGVGEVGHVSFESSRPFFGFNSSEGRIADSNPFNDLLTIGRSISHRFLQFIGPLPSRSHGPFSSLLLLAGRKRAGSLFQKDPALQCAASSQSRAEVAVSLVGSILASDKRLAELPHPTPLCARSSCSLECTWNMFVVSSSTYRRARQHLSAALVFFKRNL